MGYYYQHLRDEEFDKMSAEEKRLAIRLVDLTNPDIAEVRGNYTFVGVTYDNCKDWLIDAELFFQNKQIDVGSRDLQQNSITHRVGVEKRVFDRAFLISEVLFRTEQGIVKDKIRAFTVSSLYDAHPFIVYGGLTQ